MNHWEAILLGIVEGLTEYLPVSSTGHLILTQRLLRIPEDQASNAYAICIQSGAILAVLGLYWGRMRQMIRGAVSLDRLGHPRFGRQPRAAACHQSGGRLLPRARSWVCCWMIGSSGCCSG